MVLRLQIHVNDLSCLLLAKFQALKRSWLRGGEVSFSFISFTDVSELFIQCWLHGGEVSIQ